jgi:hypothetical protein
LQLEFQNALEAAGFDIRCQIIWDKNTFAWGFGRYKFQHEPLFYAHVADQKDPWYGDKSQSTLWEEKKPAANRIHPTAKPVELIERCSAASPVTLWLTCSVVRLDTHLFERRNHRSLVKNRLYAGFIVRRYQVCRQASGWKAKADVRPDRAGAGRGAA